MPSAVVTVIGPVDAPTGTLATICVVELTVKLAATPLKRTALGLIKLVPLIVTAVLVLPVPGENPEMVGTKSSDPLIENGPDILKKMFPTASTLSLAWKVAVPGIVTVSEPSFAVLFAKIIGNDCPSSRERVILTVSQLTGALFVLATFHVTVCKLFTFQDPG